VHVRLLLLQVGYAAFREFVVSREAGLREAFSQFDLGAADQQRCAVTQHCYCCYVPAQQ
jgi:hypothetical protein